MAAKLDSNPLTPTDDDNKNLHLILFFSYCAFPVIILSRVNMKNVGCN